LAHKDDKIKQLEKKIEVMQLESSMNKTQTNNNLVEASLSNKNSKKVFVPAWKCLFCRNNNHEQAKICSSCNSIYDNNMQLPNRPYLKPDPRDDRRLTYKKNCDRLQGANQQYKEENIDCFPTL
jgi:hypothetical protein